MFSNSLVYLTEFAVHESPLFHFCSFFQAHSSGTVTTAERLWGLVYSVLWWARIYAIAALWSQRFLFLLCDAAGGMPHVSSIYPGICSR